MIAAAGRHRKSCGSLCVTASAWAPWSSGWTRTGLLLRGRSRRSFTARPGFRACLAEAAQASHIDTGSRFATRRALSSVSQEPPYGPVRVQTAEVVDHRRPVPLENRSDRRWPPP